MPTYLNGIKFIKEGKFGIKMTINLEELAKEAANLKDERGNVKVQLSKRKENGKWGETHSASHDDWKPENQTQPSVTTNAKKVEVEEDDLNSLPF